MTSRPLDDDLFKSWWAITSPLFKRLVNQIQNTLLSLCGMALESVSAADFLCKLTGGAAGPVDLGARGGGLKGIRPNNLNHHDFVYCSSSLCFLLLSRAATHR